MNELYRYYRYHFSSKKPDRCCYCGRETIVNLVYADPSGKYCYDEDGDIAITVGTNYSTYYSTWRCDLCGQPYYQNKYDIDDSKGLFDNNYVPNINVGRTISQKLSIDPATVLGV